jgi:hypothetical protein
MLSCLFRGQCKAKALRAVLTTCHSFLFYLEAFLKCGQEVGPRACRGLTVIVCTSVAR